VRWLHLIVITITFFSRRVLFRARMTSLFESFLSFLKKKNPISFPPSLVGWRSWHRQFRGKMDDINTIHLWSEWNNNEDEKQKSIRVLPREGEKITPTRRQNYDPIKQTEGKRWPKKIKKFLKSSKNLWDKNYSIKSSSFNILFVYFFALYFSYFMTFSFCFYVYIESFLTKIDPIPFKSMEEVSLFLMLIAINSS